MKISCQEIAFSNEYCAICATTSDDGERLKKKRPDNIVAGGVSLSPEAICSGFKFIHNCILLLNTNYLNKL